MHKIILSLPSVVLVLVYLLFFFYFAALLDFIIWTEIYLETQHNANPNAQCTLIQTIIFIIHLLDLFITIHITACISFSFTVIQYSGTEWTEGFSTYNR